MGLIYEINQTKLNVEQYVRVYDSYIEIRKPNTESNKGKIGMAKMVGQIAGVINGKYLDATIPIDQIARVEFNPAKGIFATGIIQFYLKGEKESKATMFDLPYRLDAINIQAKDNGTAKKIKEYVETVIR